MDKPEIPEQYRKCFNCEYGSCCYQQSVSYGGKLDGFVSAPVYRCDYDEWYQFKCQPDMLTVTCPHFKKGTFTSGVLTGVERCKKKLEEKLSCANCCIAVYHELVKEKVDAHTSTRHRNIRP